MTGLRATQTEFAVDQVVLQSYQHLIQWVTNLALHILASVPEYKHRSGPGVSFIRNVSLLNFKASIILSMLILESMKFRLLELRKYKNESTEPKNWFRNCPAFHSPLR